jgi:hypothetical protein
MGPPRCASRPSSKQQLCASEACCGLLKARIPRCCPHPQRYLQHYGVELGKKGAEEKKAAAEGAEEAKEVREGRGGGRRAERGSTALSGAPAAAPPWRQAGTPHGRLVRFPPPSTLLPRPRGPPPA